MPSNAKSNDSIIAPSDRSLVVLVRDGDWDAATILYDRYARRVMGLVKSQMGEKLSSATEPDDLVQSVFKSIFRKVQSGHYNAPPGTTLWNLIAVVAVNKVFNSAKYHSAKCRDRERSVPLDSLGSDAVDHDAVENLGSCVREILEQLRPFDLEVVTMRIDGFTVKEISKKVERACRTVERSLENTRSMLARELLDQE